ncbi:MAG: DNA-directed RNA polymerase subunit beta' [Bacteroidales bacterium]|nr:DNA-directed RNA polymerase subunit beta' [Bacteroidales bacterium]MDD4394451.1 DNA-directed RNA polymerase subunit beta' [Bacteroidales bacterium]
MAFRKDSNTRKEFSTITISLASPESILEQSRGEVIKPETINYRTYKPERDGLFCEKIFGPTKDWECHCGKYKRIRYKGIVCDRCGVEVTERKVRRERMGHIQLVVPVAHIWFFKKIAALLGIAAKQTDAIIYYEKYVVIQAGAAQDIKLNEKDKDTIQNMSLLTEEEYFEVMELLPPENKMLDETDPNKFIAKMGAEALYDLLVKVDLDEESYRLREKANTETSQQRKQDVLKRLQVFEAFRDSRKRAENRPEWMISKIIPVIPPELRPLVPLDGGRFATSDLNDLYRRVIIRNNRLKRLIEIKAPDVIMRNEKRMLQEAVDSLFDNSKKTNSVKTESNRALKSLSDSLKGKQGRFRQNLLGKRVDYSGRSVIVVGPELHMNECGLPKDMAAELFKPFVIRKILERGIVKTVKSAKKIVDRKDPIVWDILENILKGHPVLLNRAPTLHRLGIQAFQPRLVEGKAIRLHPLCCTAFNADFDGDQMAVHVPLGNAAVLEAQMLMLASHNILNPANGSPITVPSQDMVLGLYYITKGLKSTDEQKVLGEGMKFYSGEEVMIAYNEKKIHLNAWIKCKVDLEGDGKMQLVDTTVGRIIFNQIVPKGYGYINELLTKKSLRDIIGKVLYKAGNAATAKFLDDIMGMGFKMAFQGGLSFNLGDILVPDEKATLIAKSNALVDEIQMQYEYGNITNTERSNQIIDVWTHTNANLSKVLIKKIAADRQGFNPVYMMLDSGARGSETQIRQLAGMRGLMAKPTKAGASGGEIIENPILSNFKEGLSVLEYFISTHGARKGLADTALKTADAGYLTRRLVDVSHDVIITEKDCGTLRGMTITALKKNEEIIEPLYNRLLGRVTLHDVYNPQNGELIVKAGEELDEKYCQMIEDSPIEEVEIRSVPTCESKQGICQKCYGRNLATGRMVQIGEAVGVIAAQSIGEPGTQLTLRTFHVGGVAGNVAANSRITAKNDGLLSIDELRALEKVDGEGKTYYIVIGRSAEMKIIDVQTSVALFSANIPYGAKLYFKHGDNVKKGDIIADWDPFNAVILSEVAGTIEFKDVIEGVTYRVETDEQAGTHDKVIIESRLKTKNPIIGVNDGDGNLIKTFDLPVGARLSVDVGDKIDSGAVLVKIPRLFGKSGDITGGLPRVTELFEARNPSDPAVVAEIDGVVSFEKKLKRGNRSITITSRTGETKTYQISSSKQILAQENDFVKAGTPLSEGALTPSDILNIKGAMKVQEYIVNEIQEVYRLQGVKINDKHFEVIVRQMMRKMEIEDPGDTKFLQGELINKIDFQQENDAIWEMKVVTDAGDSEIFKNGQIVYPKQLRDENSILKRRDLKLVEVRDANPATGKPILQGITRASLQIRSFISAASFQETTKVLTNAAINAKSDNLLGLKENVIVGHLIPAGTGLKKYQNIEVSSMEEYESLMASKL